MNAWLPRPSAKNANRQLSCSNSPGNVSPSAKKASLAGPSSRAAATSTTEPVARPAITAVPVHITTARRQVGRSVPLNLTSSGSVARPRDALRANP